MSTVQGIAMWASLQKPNTTYDPVWTIDVILDDKNAKIVEDLGIKTKVNDEGDKFVKIKRGTEWPDGSPKDKPEVMDTKKNPITDDVGNGSSVIVQFRPYEWKWKKKSGWNGDLEKVMVTRLIPYVAQGDADELDELDEETEIVSEVTTDEVVSDDSPFDDD